MEPIRTVDAIMTRQVVTVGMDDTLNTVNAIFHAVKFHHLLVVNEENLLVGVVSDRDVLKAISPYVGTLSETIRDQATLAKRVHQIMSRRLIVVGKDTPIHKAAQLLLDHQVSCLPVTTPELAIEGILTWKDLVKYFVSRNSTVEQSSGQEVQVGDRASSYSGTHQGTNTCSESHG
ncbi:MAG: CBS domain-containing protein [Nitrospirae bacterium]|nr:MAG: CBS domain-containing protein [Nitrospirota bacterium]